MYKYLRLVKIRRMVKSLRLEKLRRMEKSLRLLKIRRMVKSLRALKYPRLVKYWLFCTARNFRRKPDFWLPRGFRPFLGMAGRYKQPVQCRREFAYKSWAPGDHSSLGDYMRDSSHLRGSEHAHQPDQEEVSSWRFRRA